MNIGSRGTNHSSNGGRGPVNGAGVLAVLGGSVGFWGWGGQLARRKRLLERGGGVVSRVGEASLGLPRPSLS